MIKNLWLWPNFLEVASENYQAAYYGKSHVAKNSDGFLDRDILSQTGAITCVLHDPAVSKNAKRNQASLTTTNTQNNDTDACTMCSKDSYKDLWITLFSSLNIRDFRVVNLLLSRQLCLHLLFTPSVYTLCLHPLFTNSVYTLRNIQTDTNTDTRTCPRHGYIDAHMQACACIRKASNKSSKASYRH